MLTMDWSKTPYYLELGPKAEDSRNSFETIGFAMLAAGMGPELREQDVFELWARCQVLSGLAEVTATRTVYTQLTPQLLRGYIGFRINASREARTGWFKRQMDGAIQTARWHDSRRAQEANPAGENQEAANG